ncbi:MAG: alpha/beta hydrolase [Alphaproteobacteria bacterium]
MATGSEIDYVAQYNNRAMVPEHPEIFDRWSREASDYRANSIVELGAKYGDDPRHTVDLFAPDTDRGGPVAMFIHGGYWFTFDGRSFSQMAKGLIAHGIPVAVISYRLCPTVQISQIIDDVTQCCLWLHRRYARPVLPVGHSAGGHLAAALLATDWAAKDPGASLDMVDAAVSISGLFDLTPMLKIPMNDNLKLTAATAPIVSPLFWPAPVGSWLQCFVGADESDEFHRQSERIVEIWGEAGTSTNLNRLAGANHFTSLDPLTDPDSEMVEIIAALAHSLE